MGVRLIVLFYFATLVFGYLGTAGHSGKAPYQTDRAFLASVASQAANSGKVPAEWIFGWSENTAGQNFTSNYSLEAAPRAVGACEQGGAAAESQDSGNDARLVRDLSRTSVQQTAVLREVWISVADICATGQPTALERVEPEPIAPSAVAGRLGLGEQNPVAATSGFPQTEGQRLRRFWAEVWQRTAIGSRQGQRQRRGNGEASRPSGEGPAQTARAGLHFKAGGDHEAGNRRRQADRDIGFALAVSSLKRGPAARNPGSRGQGDGAGCEGEYEAVTSPGFSTGHSEARTPDDLQTAGHLPPGMEFVHLSIVYVGGKAATEQGGNASRTRPGGGSLAKSAHAGHVLDCTGKRTGARSFCGIGRADRPRGGARGCRTGSRARRGGGLKEEEDAGRLGAARTVHHSRPCEGKNCSYRKCRSSSREDAETKRQARREGFLRGLATDADMGWHRPYPAHGHTVRLEEDYTCISFAQLLALGLEHEVASLCFGSVFRVSDLRIDKDGEEHAAVLGGTVQGIEPHGSHTRETIALGIRGFGGTGMQRAWDAELPVKPFLPAASRASAVPVVEKLDIVQQMSDGAVQSRLGCRSFATSASARIMRCSGRVVRFCDEPDSGNTSLSSVLQVLLGAARQVRSPVNGDSDNRLTAPLSPAGQPRQSRGSPDESCPGPTPIQIGRGAGEPRRCIGQAQQDKRFPDESCPVPQPVPLGQCQGEMPSCTDQVQPSEGVSDVPCPGPPLGQHAQGQARLLSRASQVQQCEWVTDESCPNPRLNQRFNDASGSLSNAEQGSGGGCSISCAGRTRQSEWVSDESCPDPMTGQREQEVGEQLPRTGQVHHGRRFPDESFPGPATGWPGFGSGEFLSLEGQVHLRKTFAGSSYPDPSSGQLGRDAGQSLLKATPVLQGQGRLEELYPAPLSGELFSRACQVQPSTGSSDESCPDPWSGRSDPGASRLSSRSGQAQQGKWSPDESCPDPHSRQPVGGMEVPFLQVGQVHQGERFSDESCPNPQLCQSGRGAKRLIRNSGQVQQRHGSSDVSCPSPQPGHLVRGKVRPTGEGVVADDDRHEFAVHLRLDGDESAPRDYGDGRVAGSGDSTGSASSSEIVPGTVACHLPPAAPFDFASFDILRGPVVYQLPHGNGPEEAVSHVLRHPPFPNPDWVRPRDMFRDILPSRFF